MFEVGVAAGITALAGAVIVPMMIRERGYFSVGGEWLLLMIIAISSYTLIHNAIFEMARKEAKKNG